jgi:hypothetical protein
MSLNTLIVWDWEKPSGPQLAQLDDLERSIADLIRSPGWQAFEAETKQAMGIAMGKAEANNLDPVEALRVVTEHAVLGRMVKWPALMLSQIQGFRQQVADVMKQR